MKQPKSGKNESLQLKGVYSTPFEAKAKDGAKSLRKIYWGVWVVRPDVYEIQPLNQNMVPMGQRQRIARADFERQFSPEPDFFITRSTGEIPRADAQDGLSGQPPEAGELPAEPDSAEIEAVSREMETLHAEGRAQLMRGDKARALETFRRILALQGPFVPVHKFVFNGCGIDMRKARHLEEAVSFYKKAIEVDQADENLCHNIARALYDQGDLASALEYLRLGLSMNPEFKEARKFADFIEKRQGKAPKAASGGSRYNMDSPSAGRARGGSTDLDKPSGRAGKGTDLDKPSDGRSVSKKVYKF